MAKLIKTIALKHEINIPTPPLPLAPTSVVGTITGYTSFSLAWVDGTYATTMEVSYGTSSSFTGATTVTFNQSQSPQNFTGLISTVIYYRIRSVNSAGQSSYVSGNLDLTTYVP